MIHEARDVSCSIPHRSAPEESREDLERAEKRPPERQDEQGIREESQHTVPAQTPGGAIFVEKGHIDTTSQNEPESR